MTIFYIGIVLVFIVIFGTATMAILTRSSFDPVLSKPRRDKLKIQRRSSQARSGHALHGNREPHA